MKNFRTYQLAISFNREAAKLKLPAYLKDQLQRAAASIALNLAEGAGRFGRKDQRRFFNIALASLRECQAVLDLHSAEDSSLKELADSLGAHLYKLMQAC